jgi:hypothetical protein
MLDLQSLCKHPLRVKTAIDCCAYTSKVVRSVHYFVVGARAPRCMLLVWLLPAGLWYFEQDQRVSTRATRLCCSQTKHETGPKVTTKHKPKHTTGEVA